jgi:FKBP-type peptidyl-prolyl cis-trans isomerase FklB
VALPAFGRTFFAQQVFMKMSSLTLSFLLAAALAGSVLAGAVRAEPAPASPTIAPMPDALKDPKAQVGYALGLRIGAQMRAMGVGVDPQALAKGVQDATSGAKPLLTEDQARAVMVKVQAEATARRQETASRAGEANQTQGAAFLKANAAKPGVVTLPSGLQYQVLTAGTGPKPKAADTVVCNYRGTLIDGTEFDSSYGRGSPSSFPVSGVIKGWTEALQLMPVGSKWRLVVPASLAYGDDGAGAQIGPDAVLIFEVELLSIK